MKTINSNPYLQSPMELELTAAPNVWRFTTYTPISTEDALEENPELVNTSPYEEGWFFKLKVSDENLESIDSLMTAEEYSSMLDGNS